METGLLIVAVPILLQAVAIFYSAFEARQVGKSNFLQIVHFHQERFEDLWKDMGDLRNVIEAEKVNLGSIKRKNRHLYIKLGLWAERYFWLCFDEWTEGHLWKSVPKYISRTWDEGIKDAMGKPFYRQIWEREFQDKNFRGEKRFNRFISNFLENSPKS